MLVFLLGCCQVAPTPCKRPDVLCTIAATATMAPPNVIPAPDPNHVLSNWVHTDGVVSLAYSPDGQFLYSGGADSLIRRFDPANPNEDPEVISQNEEAVTALDASVGTLAESLDGS